MAPASSSKSSDTIKKKKPLQDYYKDWRCDEVSELKELDCQHVSDAHLQLYNSVNAYIN